METGAGPERLAHAILVAHGVEQDGPTVTVDSAARHD
jgi:hypothetical protein